MRSAVKRARESESGFTLIELLIVIVILGVLAAIVVFSVNGITNKGYKASCQATVASIDTAYEAAIAQGSLTATQAQTISNLGAFFHSGTAPTSVTNTAGNPVTLTTVSAADALVVGSGACT